MAFNLLHRNHFFNLGRKGKNVAVSVVDHARRIWAKGSTLATARPSLVVNLLARCALNADFASATHCVGGSFRFGVGV